MTETIRRQAFFFFPRFFFARISEEWSHNEKGWSTKFVRIEM